MKRVDVAIIGGGPAGSVLATLLARRGASTLLIDRDVFPRDKVCGEFLSWDAIPLLDRPVLDAIRDAGAAAIERGRIVGRRRTLEFSLPAPAIGVSRVLLDHLLLERARTAGATVLEGTVATDLQRLNDRHQVIVQRENATTCIDAAVVVGAWGRWGRFDQKLARAFTHDRRTRSFGFKRHYTGGAPAAAESIDLYAFAGGYLGVNHVEGGLANICGLVHAERLTGLKGGWESFIEKLRTEEPRLDALYEAHRPAQDAFLTSEPVIFRARSPIEAGVFMTGDASGIVDPLTGNGMAMAVQSAWLAAPAILRLLAAPGNRGSIEREYGEAHHRLFGGRIRWSRAIASLLSRPRVLEQALATAGRARVVEMLVRKTRATERQIDELRGAVS